MSSPLRSILAATDLGRASDSIVRSAAILAIHTGAELHLLHSLELPWAPSEDVIRRSGLASQIESAKDRLRDQIERAVPQGIRPASQEIVFEPPYQAILDRATETAADVVVVGPHRGGAAGARFLGTTADRVIRSAEIPCLVVKEPLPDRIRRIGVPTDFSDPSQGALETALSWGVQLGAEGADGSPEVRVMYVGWPVEQADNPEMEEQTVRPELRGQVERATSRVPGATDVKVDLEVIWANTPSEATADWADTAGIDLLVMGTHGRSGLKRALIGSMAAGIARRTPRPVLLVPPALWDGE